MANIEQLLETISSLSIIECAELAKALEEKFGVSASMMASAAPAAGAAAAVEEKSEYKVELIDGGPDKMKAIKALRQVKKDMGLGDAKKAVEETPTLLAAAATKEEAQSMKEILEAAGAKVKVS
ncbi:MAG: 50S ribosomal protein L7/L12 [candidate division TM6 bacterium GW2011_GWE2_41_16]|nr:MAG: 50S ribosomal protein L7/L12 [candidate division TM6 bacterium GW2011_GWE2_41_16]